MTIILLTVRVNRLEFIYKPQKTNLLKNGEKREVIDASTT